MKLYPNLMTLKDYVPADRATTCEDEIVRIGNTLKFAEATPDDLYNYRTLTVSIWGSRYRDLRERKEYDKAEDVWQGMLSITSAIDNEMWKRGETV